MSQPRLCDACGSKPVIAKTYRHCYDCEPGGPHTVPPCRRCGSQHDYYSAGLCSRCHHLAPQPTESCCDCHAWGVVRQQKWLCAACIGWRQSSTGIAGCTNCDQSRHLGHEDLCRLCWRVAVDARVRFQPLNAIHANRHGQQLFFANLKRVGPSRDPIVTPRPPRRSRRVTHRQLELFDRAPSWAERHGIAEPPDGVLALRLDRLCVEHATRHGWSRNGTERAQLALRVVQGLHYTPGAPIALSDVITTTARFGWSTRPVQTVLAEAGILHDNRIPAIEPWFAKHVEGLPAPMINELTVWFDVLRHGSQIPPRRHPRDEYTIRGQLRSALPVLRRWAVAGHSSLRDITRAEVLAALPGAGTQRAMIGGGLRSIFIVLKDRKIIFANPTARIVIGQTARRDPLPVDQQTIRATLDSLNPACAAIASLALFHGLGSRDLRRLHLIDTRNGRLHLNGRVMLLAAPVKERLSTYLDERNRRWPNTANPHLFIHKLTAVTTDEVGQLWILRTLGTTVKGLREDRILDEVLASGGDLRRVGDLFGLDIKSAVRYTKALAHPDLNDPPTALGS